MPVWHTAQHDSKSCVADAAFCTFRKNGLTFRDEFQTLVVRPEGMDADIVTVQNLNRQSKGFSDYFWFGVSLYDNRREVTRIFAMQDVSQARKKGTEKYIYDVGLAPFTSQVVAKRDWVAVRGDLLPHIRAGMEECWKRGFLSDSKDLADYRVSGVFFGWEIPCLNDAAVAVKSLSLAATVTGK